MASVCGNFKTGAGVNAPVAVFEYEGDQYVVAYSGGSTFAPAPRGDSLFLFSLKGTLTSGSQNASQTPVAAGEHR